MGPRVTLLHRSSSAISQDEVCRVFPQAGRILYSWQSRMARYALGNLIPKLVAKV